MLLIASLSSFGQQQKKVAVTSSDMIESLSKGILVCVIPDHSEKLDILERELLVAKAPARRRRLERLISQTQMDRNVFKQQLMSAVDSIYDFSKFAFISSSDLPSFHESRDQSILLEGQAIERGNQIFYLMRGSLESGADALMITDADLNPLGRPYPYYVRLQGVASLIESFFSPRDKWRKMDKTIEKLNDRLHRYLSD